MFEYTVNNDSQIISWNAVGEKPNPWNSCSFYHFAEWMFKYDMRKNKAFNCYRFWKLLTNKNLNFDQNENDLFDKDAKNGNV